MLTEVTIENYRSIVKATVKLQPFTLLVGANGSGKSNFLRCLKNGVHREQRHVNFELDDSKIAYCDGNKRYFEVLNNDIVKCYEQEIAKELFVPRFDLEKFLGTIRIFNLNSNAIGEAEVLQVNPSVNEDGTGAIQVLDALKTGIREDLFDKIEATFKKYIPEVTKIGLVSGNNVKSIAIKEKHLDKPLPLSELSEGTRLILTILTIVYQENPPSIICIEDIDRGLNPKLYKKLIQLCFDLTSQEGAPQIIAITHNPYLVSEFQGKEDCVVVVEKEDGETHFTSMNEKIAHLDPEDLEEWTLGELWATGLFNLQPMMA